jgi:hypothetical protein
MVWVDVSIKELTQFLCLQLISKIVNKHHSQNGKWCKFKIYDGEKTASSINVAGKSGYPSARNWN